MSEEHFKKLNDLIRLAGEKHDTSQVRPSEETLYACLEGRATQNQLNEVQSALLGSSAFRREFKQMIADYQALANLTADPVFQNSETILPQALQQQIREEYPNAEASFLTPGTVPPLELVNVQLSSPESSRASFLTRALKTLASSRIAQLGIVGVAAAVTFMVISSPTPVQLQWDGTTATVSKELLIPINTRGATKVVTASDTAKDAALIGFRELGGVDISIEGAPFIPKPEESHNSVLSWFDSLKKLTIVDQKERELGVIWVNEDELFKDGATDLQLWALNLTTFELQQTDLPDIEHPIKLGAEMTRPVALTVTYNQNGKYHSAGGVVIQ